MKAACVERWGSGTLIHNQLTADLRSQMEFLSRRGKDLFPMGVAVFGGQNGYRVRHDGEWNNGASPLHVWAPRLLHVTDAIAVFPRVETQWFHLCLIQTTTMERSCFLGGSNIGWVSLKVSRSVVADLRPASTSPPLAPVPLTRGATNLVSGLTKALPSNVPLWPSLNKYFRE
ncbi:hypothetical protein NE237_019560 [Protea cynaroides]|uniref:Uncharacterized protein n=1 Tax=Protea cynaroides TaxID=273540 RepID=A0A9Q0H7R3_9MAGN|nr:hypothetical protein NE237_019560 [Protea cynaroides]